MKRCLDSLVGLDQVVVYDTGSTDKTMEVARDCGADVFGGLAETPFHFGKARNVALAQVKQRWAFSIDADEVLREGSIGPMIKAARGRADVAGYDVLHVNRAEKGGSEMPSLKLRLFRADQFVWHHRVHEQPIPKGHGKQAKVGFIKRCIIDHFPEPERAERRGQNLELLKLCVEEEPRYMQAWKQLGIEYILRENWADAIPPLEQYMKHPDAAPPHEDCAVRMFLGKCHARLKDMDKALRVFHEAHQKAPARREPLYWAALELINFGDPWTAIKWLEGALKIEPNHLPEFSLYSEAVQGNLVQETLGDWQKKLKEAQEAWKAGQRPAQTK